MDSKELTKIELSQSTDEELVVRAANADDDALDFIMYKYRNIVKAKAQSYFLIGADHDDILQEGTIGLYKAIRDYDINKNTPFRPFAELCITRQIINAIKTATRQKHIPLNSYISLNKPVYDEESERTLIDIISGEKMNNPEEMFIGQEEYSSIEKKIHELLSNFEQQVLNNYLSGKTYQEMAEEMDKHVKSIDNALQRAKRKLEKYLDRL